MVVNIEGIEVGRVVGASLCDDKRLRKCHKCRDGLHHQVIENDGGKAWKRDA